MRVSWKLAVSVRALRARPGSFGVGLVLVAAGLMFTTSAQTAKGTQLRPDQADLTALIHSETAQFRSRLDRAAELRQEIRERTRAVSAGNAALSGLEDQVEQLGLVSGVEPLRGPGVVVSLDDAPRDAPVPPQAGPDDLVVHQQDVQAVVNALWAGGAEGMMLQDQRVIATSAVRCVGNTLILQGRVYSPPYVITAVGDVAGMRRALRESPEVAYYLEYVRSLRLGWSVRTRGQLDLPAYAGSLELQHARVAGNPTDTTNPPASTATTSPPNR